jgi:outer membrane protein assembly factor BamD
VSIVAEHNSPIFFRRSDTVRRTLPIFAAAVLVLLVMGCNGIFRPKVPDEKASAEDLYKLAQKRYESKSYRDAIEMYDRLRSAYPDFAEIPKVYHRIADAYFALGEYEEAISRYDQFLQLYPNNPGRFRAKYQIGMCYFKRMPGIDRDDTMVRRAEAEFKALVDDPAAGEWQKKAEKKYKICRIRLAEKELYKADTYLSLGKYKAAKMAARRVITRYSGLGLDKRAQRVLDKAKGR